MTQTLNHECKQNQEKTVTLWLYALSEKSRN